MTKPLLLAAFVLLTFASHAQNFATISNGTSHHWKPEWNNFIADGIKAQRDIFLNDAALPRQDILDVCPGYFSATEDEKIAFWTLFIASIANFESEFNPKCRFKEPAPLNNYSEGLLQLSYGDENVYRGIPLSTKAKNILDPKVNLQSGVIILAKQLTIKKKLFTSKYFYWSVLTNKKQDIITFFRRNSAILTFCR